MKKNLKGVCKIHTPFYDLLDKGLLFLFVGLCLIFVLYPIICIVFQSITLDGSLSFEIYKNIIGENKGLLINSILTALLSAGISTCLAATVALFIYFLSPILNKIGKFFLMVSMISPPFIASLAYIQLFGRRGYVTYHLLGLNFDPYGMHGVIIMQVIGFIPLSGLMILAVIEKVDKRLLKASLDLGSSKNSAVVNILIPMIKPGIAVAFLLSFVRSLSDFGTVTIIGGGFETIATDIYMEIIGYANFSKAAAMNILLLIPALIIFIPYRRNMEKLNQRSKDNDSGDDDGFRIEVNSYPKIIISTISLVFFIIMLTQYICIFISAFSKFSK
ncbi:MAG: ABC transporter permease subunit, partial [Clostridium sp.]